MKKNSKILILALIMAALDQLIKVIIKLNLSLHQEIVIIKNFFSLTYYENTGAAFSLFNNQTIILTIISIICFIYFTYYICKTDIKSKLEGISLGLILGGILGNLLDRLILNKVIDYLDFNIFNYDFPIFNLADSCITIGVILFIIYLFKEEKFSS